MNSGIVPYFVFAMLCVFAPLRENTFRTQVSSRQVAKFAKKNRKVGHYHSGAETKGLSECLRLREAIKWGERSRAANSHLFRLTVFVSVLNLNCHVFSEDDLLLLQQLRRNRIQQRVIQHAVHCVDCTARWICAATP